jgi:predicted nucleic acid-binding protein
MKPLLLDTNIIDNVLRKRNERHLLVDDLLDQGQPTRAFMKSLLFLAITEDIAEQAGRLKAQYAKRGTTLSFQDAGIAAVCIAYGCTLVTENAKDFPMPDLQLYPLS